MSVSYDFKKGIDLPQWVWLTQCPVSFLISNAVKYDGARYIYVVQSTTLHRYDTWSDGWQSLAVPTTGVAGQDMVFDSIRNVLIYTCATTAWQVFNLNNTAVTIAGVVCNPWVVTTMTPILPTTLATGAVLAMPKNLTATDYVRNGTAGSTGQTTTNVNASADIFYPELVGLTLRVTSGTQSGQKRTISARVDANDVTLATALPGALAAGDTFTIEVPSGTATAGAVGTLTDTGQAWITNKYTNWDVEITSGTGSGQRRRIASNTATVLTLAGAVTGNPRTGNFSTAPDATSVYRIVPSTDFLYYGTGATFWKLDVVASPAAAWASITAPPAAVGAGAGFDFSRLVAPGHMYALRGSATATVYAYDIGLNTWATLTTYPGTETFTTGTAMVLLSNLGKLAVYDDLTTRVLALDLATGNWDTLGNHPYVAGTTVEGKRIEEVISPDGARFLYLARTGGQEWFRVALEWL